MTALAQIADLVRRETGIVLPAGRERAILAAVDRAAPGLGPREFARAAQGPRADPGLVSRLIDEVTVQETEFLRDRRQLDAIDWPRLLGAARAAGPGTIRVWSAGCASGEEAYTLALLAAEAFAPAAPPVDVLGTDISGAALAAAQAGRYRGRSVRGLAAAVRRRYLDPQPDGSYLVGGSLRGLVRLRRHNLARDPVPPPGESGFDLIVCRNVLIYFEESIVPRVIDSLGRSLRTGGELVLGAADALLRAGDRPAAQPSAQLKPVTGPAWGTGHRSPSRAGASPRRPPRGEPAPTREQRLAAALDAAGRGDRDVATAQVSALLAADALDTDALFVDGLVSLEAGRPAGAVTTLRRALCADPGFGLAAFTLGRAYDELGDRGAARRCYETALRTLDPDDDRHGQMLQQVDIGDIAAACRTRLRG